MINLKMLCQSGPPRRNGNKRNSRKESDVADEYIIAKARLMACGVVAFINLRWCATPSPAAHVDSRRWSGREKEKIGNWLTPMSRQYSSVGGPFHTHRGGTARYRAAKLYVPAASGPFDGDMRLNSAREQFPRNILVASS